MRMLVFRHGVAERVAPDGGDAVRALTPAGVKETGAAVRGLAAMASLPDVILTSPKQRAVQTANAVARAFGVEPEGMEALADGSVEDVVSHSAAGFVELHKAGCASLDVDFATAPPRASLAWLATPDVLRTRRRLRREPLAQHAAPGRVVS